MVWVPVVHSLAPMPPPDHRLRSQLKLRDLVYMQLILVVGLNFTGFAAKQGSSQVILWLFALVLFYLPLSAVVMQLSRAIPLEGGVYQWVKEGLSPFAGFMAGWSVAIYCIVFSASYGSQLASSFAYAGGPGFAWMEQKAWFALVVLVDLCLVAAVLNVRGLGFIRWLSGIGGILTLAIAAVMGYLLLRAPHNSLRGMSLAMPGFTLLTANVFTKMALFALTGLDQCAIFTEECRRPRNDVARSVLISGPLIALMYIVVTSSLLAYVRPAQIDLAAPLSQVLHLGFGPTLAGQVFTLFSVIGFATVQIATLMVVVGLVARLPMVAGWDGVLPAWWSELHPRFRVPVKAIAAVAASMIVIGALSLLGAQNQEAVQVLNAAAFGSYCIMYLLMFGSVLFGFGRSSWRPGVPLRLAALSAFLVVLIALGFQLIPLGNVSSSLLFAFKVAIAICGTNGVGALLYGLGKRQRRLAPAVPPLL